MAITRAQANIEELRRVALWLESTAASPMPKHTADDAAESVWIFTYKAMLSRDSTPQHSASEADKAVACFNATCRPWLSRAKDER
jgi:hypothetical protein